jgi:hypothetical protein
VWANAGAITQESYNLVGTGDKALFDPRNHNDILWNTPGLAGKLDNNNALPGYPLTLALSTTSKAYEKGDPTLAGQIDERGRTRPLGVVSIGAEDPDAT